jgi:hypothetical protein
VEDYRIHCGLMMLADLIGLWKGMESSFELQAPEGSSCLDIGESGLPHLSPSSIARVKVRTYLIRGTALSDLAACGISAI